MQARSNADLQNSGATCNAPSGSTGIYTNPGFAGNARLFVANLDRKNVRNSCDTRDFSISNAKMYLMYHDDEEGNRVYTLQVCAAFQPVVQQSAAATHCYALLAQKAAPDGAPTQSAHPARFSPDDKFSRERIICKKRFQLLPTQQKALEL